MNTSATAGALRPNRTRTLTVGANRPALVTVECRDRGRPFVLLHGGGGPASMAGFADLLAERTHSHVLLPTHPGFAGTAIADGVDSVRDLAAVYIAMLDQLALVDVTLIGNSFGGWLAAEMALLDSPRVSGLVIVDGIGIEVAGHPMLDVRGLSPEQIRAHSFHATDVASPSSDESSPPHGPSPDVRSLIRYAGETMCDKTLLERLAGIEIPAHVIWGESDGIVDVEYGKAYADAIEVSTFTLLRATGHLPQVETPEELLGAMLDLGSDPAVSDVSSTNAPTR
ncbi:alpha/beta hydrolase [Gordonia sp. ABSL11-1]|uniref:alpha/beta fold hydrolase n=1 Tax=Gordonia sp. ABSL11-1 TaxID=3053924 RepID=UPI0025723390|nr:alpha/beta hydrolase [Gordonia sp. ABSL11-1]MDL9948112.1 alpha/beta hydrolase [Gordonia sp. ABSL11-1]